MSMMLVSLISYVDRNTLALLAPTILRECRLTGEQYGFIIAAFSVCYMAGNPLWGLLLDRIGLRIGMTAAVSFWSVASAAHAWAGGFWSFAAARAALGLGEGATFPGGLRTVTQTLRFTEQARGMAVAYSGGSLGAIITPLLITPVALRWGWRAAFLFTGVLGVIWLLLWAFLSRRPDLRPRPAAPPSSSAVRIRAGDPRLWGFVAAYMLGALPLGFIMYSAALYLDRVHGVSQTGLGKLLWIPPLGWEVGYFAWGWILDGMARRGVPRYRAVRRLMFASVFLSLPLAAVPSLTPLWLVMFALFFAMFVTVGFVVPSVAYAVHAFTHANSGLVAGIGAGSFGAGVAIFMPLFGKLFDQQWYHAAFSLAALLPTAGYLVWRTTHRGDPDAGAASPFASPAIRAKAESR